MHAAFLVWRHAFRSLTLKAAYIRLASFKAACISLASIVGKVASYPDPTPILPRTVLRFTETDVNAEKEMATSTWEEEVKALASPDAQNPHSAALREYVVAFQSDLLPYREDWILNGMERTAGGTTRPPASMVALNGPFQI